MELGLVFQALELNSPSLDFCAMPLTTFMKETSYNC